MEVISFREFRTNQSKILNAAKNGSSVVLTSRIGSFRLVPITENDKIDAIDRTPGIIKGLNEAMLIENGKMECQSIESLIDEL